MSDRPDYWTFKLKKCGWGYEVHLIKHMQSAFKGDTEIRLESYSDPWRPTLKWALKCGNRKIANLNKVELAEWSHKQYAIEWS